MYGVTADQYNLIQPNIHMKIKYFVPVPFMVVSLNVDF